MIRKLLKYDIKSSARYLLPLYMVFLAITIINGVINPFEVLENVKGFNLQMIFSTIIIILYFIMAFGILIGTAIIMIQRYYKNLLGDEGYLSFTLPVKPWQHIVSKLINTVLWTIISILIVFVSALIISRTSMSSFIDGFRLFLDELGIVFGSSIYISFPLYMIIAFLLSILIIFNAIIIGHQFQNKIAASFVAYFVLYLITQLAILLTIVIYMLTSYSSFANIPMNPDSIPNGDILFASLSVVLLILAIGHYLSINYLFKNRLNLD